jgi:hypothetical protein
VELVQARQRIAELQHLLLLRSPHPRFPHRPDAQNKDAMPRDEGEDAMRGSEEGELAERPNGSHGPASSESAGAWQVFRVRSPEGQSTSLPSSPSESEAQLRRELEAVEAEARRQLEHAEEQWLKSEEQWLEAEDMRIKADSALVGERAVTRRLRGELVSVRSELVRMQSELAGERGVLRAVEQQQQQQAEAHLQVQRATAHRF